ncbi:hypothetical protein CRENBAI_012587 [Crenichthys baileyi]|uniref:Uncharacterized protein n=1 Tax=Crenichthys baileyi TaxID=28760 RepID=A0AAV9R1M1_9TELE
MRHTGSRYISPRSLQAALQTDPSAPGSTCPHSSRDELTHATQQNSPAPAFHTFLFNNTWQQNADWDFFYICSTGSITAEAFYLDYGCPMQQKDIIFQLDIALTNIQIFQAFKCPLLSVLFR